MFYRKRIKELQEQIEVHVQKINEQQRTYNAEVFYMVMLDLTKESSLAQVKNNELNNIQFRRSSSLAFSISTLAVICTCLIFVLQITDRIPNTKWQNNQTELQEQLLERNKKLSEIFIYNNSRQDSIIKLNHDLIQLINRKYYFQEAGK